LCLDTAQGVYCLVCVTAFLVVKVGVGLDGASVHHLWERNGFVQSAHVLQSDALGGAAQAAQHVHCASCLLSDCLYLLPPFQLGVEGQPQVLACW
jgi:hypothetical protein